MRLPGGLCGGPTHEGDLPQEGDLSVVMKHWSWNLGGIEHPGEPNNHLNEKKKPELVGVILECKI